MTPLAKTCLPTVRLSLGAIPAGDIPPGQGPHLYRIVAEVPNAKTVNVVGVVVEVTAEACPQRPPDTSLRDAVDSFELGGLPLGETEVRLAGANLNCMLPGVDRGRPCRGPTHLTITLLAVACSRAAVTIFTDHFPEAQQHKGGMQAECE